MISLGKREKKENLGERGGSVEKGPLLLCQRKRPWVAGSKKRKKEDKNPDLLGPACSQVVKEKKPGTICTRGKKKKKASVTVAGRV